MVLPAGQFRGVNTDFSDVTLVSEDILRYLQIKVHDEPPNAGNPPLPELHQSSSYLLLYTDRPAVPIQFCACIGKMQ